MSGSGAAFLLKILKYRPSGSSPVDRNKVQVWLRGFVFSSHSAITFQLSVYLTGDSEFSFMRKLWQQQCIYEYKFWLLLHNPFQKLAV